MSGSISRIVLTNTNYCDKTEKIAPLSSITSRMPLFDNIKVLTSASVQYFPASLDVNNSVDSTRMINFHVIENIWTHEVTVTASLVNAVIVPEIAHLLDFAE